MHRPLLILGTLVGAFVLFLFGLFVVNQTAQVVQLASVVHPHVGRLVLFLLLALYAGLIGVPAFLLYRLPRPLAPPQSQSGPEFDAYLDQLRSRLADNPRLQGACLADQGDIQAALDRLAADAEAIVRRTAGEVFVATAVSQNGRLDALVILVAQTRMVLRIARLYHQRPAPGELVRLYANVAGTAFLATELQDVDLSDQVQPILASVVGALGTSLPGMKSLATVVAGSMLDGAANAFLTLRIGVITSRYCASLSVPEKSAIRQAATVRAAALLGGIVLEGSNRVRAALWKASLEKAKDVGGRVKEKLWSFRGTPRLEAEA